MEERLGSGQGVHNLLTQRGGENGIIVGLFKIKNRPRRDRMRERSLTARMGGSSLTPPQADCVGKQGERRGGIGEPWLQNCCACEGDGKEDDDNDLCAQTKSVRIATWTHVD
jgi:hypothetical protein